MVGLVACMACPGVGVTLALVVGAATGHASFILEWDMHSRVFLHADASAAAC